MKLEAANKVEAQKGEHLPTRTTHFDQGKIFFTESYRCFLDILGFLKH
jgi:hypothetical protein